MWRNEYTKIVNDMIQDTPGTVFYLDPTNGSDGNQGTKRNPMKTFPNAYAFTQTGHNDVIRLIGGASGVSLAAALALPNNMTHIVGLGGSPRMNKRARIGMSTAFTPMITLSGYGCLIKDIYTMHGTLTGQTAVTAANDLVGWSIAGARNEFDNVHFGGPMEGTVQSVVAGYIGVDVVGDGNTFKNCVFGTDTIQRTLANCNVQLEAGTLTIFEDCIFLMNTTDGLQYFINIQNTSGYTWCIMKRCIFLCMEPNVAVACAVGINVAGGSTCYILMDPETQFYNTTAIVAAGKNALWQPKLFVTTSAPGNLAAKLA
jgi:hypothetical protein